MLKIEQKHCMTSCTWDRGCPTKSVIDHRTWSIKGHSMIIVWCNTHYPTLAREFQGFRVWGKFVFRTLELTDTPTNLANQVKVGHALDQSRSVQSKTMSRHGDRRGQIAAFRDSFETIKGLYLLFKCGIKTKTHFEWLLWHWSSLGQLNLEPTRPNGLVGCKVPTDLKDQCQRSHAHGFSLYNNTEPNAIWFPATLYKLRSVQNTGTCYPGQGWFVRNLGWGISAVKPVHVCYNDWHRSEYSRNSGKISYEWKL